MVTPPRMLDQPAMVAAGPDALRSQLQSGLRDPLVSPPTSPLNQRTAPHTSISGPNASCTSASSPPKRLIHRLALSNFGQPGSPDFTNNAQAKDFKAKYRAKYGRDPGAYSMYEWDGVYLLAQAIKNANGSTKAAAIRTLRT